jgi:outer membrane protein assembly factor BamB
MGSNTSPLAGPDPAQVAWASTIPNSRTDGRHEILGTASPLQLTSAGGGLVLARATDTGGSSTVGGEAELLYALRQSDGSVAWTVDGLVGRCTPAVHGDLIWAVRRDGPDPEDWQLVTIDGAGTVQVRYTQTTWDATDVPLTACASGLRFLSDGSVVLLHHWGGVPAGTGYWLRVISPDGTELWRRHVEAPGDDPIHPDVRVGPVGSPNADTIYLYAHDQMGTGNDVDDVLYVRALDPSDGSTLATAEVPGTRWGSAGMVMRADGAMFVATRQHGAAERPDLPDDVVGYFARLSHDGGANLSLLYANAARHGTTDPGALGSSLIFLAAGDGDTILGTYDGMRQRRRRPVRRRWRQALGDERGDRRAPLRRRRRRDRLCLRRLSERAVRAERRRADALALRRRR